jgi:two-component system cell cycle response regulator
MTRADSLPPAPSRPRRILVVDDDEARRGAMTTILRQDDYEIDACGGECEVVERVRQGGTDLVLLSSMLEDAQAFELCGELRMHDESRLMPIVLYSPVDDDEDSTVRGLLAGADDFVIAPQRSAELRARVRVQLRNRRDRELLQWAREQRTVLKDVANKDPLTGIANRRAGDDALTEAIADGGPLMIVLIDVDHFKRINDNYGHPAGDAILREVATTIDRRTRRGDTAARFGGEEFIVVIRGAGHEHAARIGERYRLGISEIELPQSGSQRVTASLGVACWEPVAPRMTAGELLKRADDALYVAKRTGRNRVSVWGVADPLASPNAAEVA